MNKQKGQVIILVLLFLAAGSLTIVPLLRLMDTGLRSQRASEKAVSQQYTTDSSMDDAMWQMMNGVMDTLSTTTPSYSYNINLGTNTSGVNISIPSIPPSGWQDLNKLIIKTEVIPNWIKAQPGTEPVYRYVISIYSPQAWRLTNMGLTLPKGLDYVASSTYAKGPARKQDLDSRVQPYMPPPMPTTNLSPELLISYQPMPTFIVEPQKTTEPDGSKTLRWNTLPSSPGAQYKYYFQTFQARGYLPWGIYYIKPWFQSTTDNWIVYSDPTAALASAMYYVIIDSGGVTYRVVIAYDSVTGEMVIVSYDIVS